MQTFPVLQFIPSILMALVLLGGIILMAVNRSQLGGAAVSGMIGCVLLLLGVVFNALLGFLLPSLVDSTGFSIGATAAVWGLVSFLFNASGTGLLILAVIARRKPPRDTPSQNPGWQQQPYPPNYG